MFDLLSLAVAFLLIVGLALGLASVRPPAACYAPALPPPTIDHSSEPERDDVREV
jgi:hypothetical protein